MRLVLTDEALERVLKDAYDPQYGARPLKRYLERQITNQLSRLIMAGTLPDHAEVRVVPAAVDGLDLRVGPATHRAG